MQKKVEQAGGAATQQGMKFKSKPRPARSNLTVLRQLCNLIPNHLVPQLARQTGVDQRARTFTPWSHLVTLLYAQLTHALGLNDVCDALRLHSGPLSAIRGAKAPARNTLSHANKHRDPELAEQLFWRVLEHLQRLQPGFGGARRGRKWAWRFQRPIHVVDATTIQLIASCLDWAKHRRRKAAAKCHLRLSLQSLLPRFALVGTAKEPENLRARELCAGVREGEIVIFDKAYLDFQHLRDLGRRGVFWVTRAKNNLKCRVLKRRIKKAQGAVLRDDEIGLTVPRSRRAHPERLRRVIARVEIDGREPVMEFLTNHLEWSPGSVADLYRCRWQIEVFFKQIKQTLQLADFLGHSAHAVRWQVWTGLLTYVLLRFMAYVSRWHQSFTRLFALARSAVWEKIHLRDLLVAYGTAGGSFRMLGRPQQAYLPGMDQLCGTAIGLSTRATRRWVQEKLMNLKN